MELLYISKFGEAMSLYNNELFYLTNADGLTSSSTNISSIVIGGVEGDSINNIQAQPRGIVLDLRIKSGVNVEYAKREILRVIKLKQKGTLEWTQNERTLQIKGVIESVEMPRFNNGVTMQISIHCEQPFWEDVEQIVSEINEAKPLHWFTANAGEMLYFEEAGRPLSEYDTSRTRTFYNTGDVAVGMTIEILAYKEVTNPIIYNQNGNFFGITYTMAEGDSIVINTRMGEKSAIFYPGELTKWRVWQQMHIEALPVNCLDYITPNSTWLQLEAGANVFSINSDDSDTDNVTFALEWTQRYV